MTQNTRLEARAAAGLEVLDRWLCDLLRLGLASAAHQPPMWWEDMAHRMMDADAPGLARRIRRMAEMSASAVADWTERVLEHVALLHLLTQAFARMESLTPEAQADVRMTLGWMLSSATDPVWDGWSILGRSSDQSVTWLCGRQTGRWARIAAPTAEVGTEFQGTVAFYPGSVPLDAEVVKKDGDHRSPGTDRAMASVNDVLARCGQAFNRNPWLEVFPVGLEQVVPVPSDVGWALRDRSDRLMRLSAEPIWQLLALSGGHPLTVFGEWDGRCPRVCSVVIEDKWVPL